MKALATRAAAAVLGLTLAAGPALAQENSADPDSGTTMPAGEGEGAAPEVPAAPGAPSTTGDDQVPKIQPAPGAARARGALLRGLDKITGRTSDLPVAVGEAVRFGRLEVRLGDCRFPAADPSSDAFAELTIIDTMLNRTVFAGWMVASSPALSAMDDARYDVWVVSCQNGSPAAEAAQP